MENHPIPQDVTGFKFRLIGSITVKQFLYLLGAGIVALIFYVLPIPIYIKIPAMFFPGIVGLALAFVPIDGRPMDKMIANFAKTIPSENQYIYHKKGVEMPYFYFTPAPQHAKTGAQQNISAVAVDKAELFNKLSRSYFKPDEEEQKGIASLSSLFSNGTPGNSGIGSKVIHADAPVQTPPSLTSVATPGQLIPPSEAARPHIPTVPIAAEKMPASEPVAQAPQNPAPAVASQAAVQTGQNSPVQPVPQQTTPQPLPQQTVVQPAQPQQTGPLPSQEPSQFDAPNIIKGVVKDPRGKLLPHIIVEVLDSNNVPVRTFRTNQNGVFAAVTPMPSGFYTIHFEDTLKKQEFQDVTFELTGKILPPLEIVSQDQREKLRRELFGVAPSAPTV